MLRINNALLAGAVCSFILIAVSAKDARAALVYENVGGANLIYDNLTNTTWTQDAGLSGPLTYQAAVTWAEGLTIAGTSWELPTEAEFTSLYTALYPYGVGPGPQSNKFGATVPFGAGPNDYASNVQTTYWTNTTQGDFNFFYGYSGYQPVDSTLYAGWAVEGPEPSPFLLLFAGIIAMGFFRMGRLAEFFRARG